MEQHRNTNALTLINPFSVECDITTLMQQHYCINIHRVLHERCPITAHAVTLLHQCNNIDASMYQQLHISLLLNLWGIYVIAILYYYSFVTISRLMVQ